VARATREQYVRWVKQFLRFHRRRDGSWKPPGELRGPEVAAFLTHMAVERRLSESSQNQALCAIVFLYQFVLDELPKDHLGEIRALRSTRPRTVPTVLSGAEVRALIDALPIDSDCGLMVRLMYGTGMRIGEVCTLRVRDVDFDRCQIVIRQAKGKKDRVVMLPAALRGPVFEHLRVRREMHECDLHRLAGYVPLPDSVANKAPRNEREWGWQYVFPSVTVRYGDDRRGVRWHTTPAHVHRTIAVAARAWELPSASRRTRCATALPRTCWSKVGMFAKCRRCSGMRA
jgi:integrase